MDQDFIENIDLYWIVGTMPPHAAAPQDLRVSCFHKCSQRSMFYISLKRHTNLGLIRWTQKS